jgi:hypothetical protein
MVAIWSVAAGRLHHPEAGPGRRAPPARLHPGDDAPPAIVTLSVVGDEMVMTFEGAAPAAEAETVERCWPPCSSD